MKRPEEKAFEAGFRVTKEGKLYNLNGKEYKCHLAGSRFRFYVHGHGKRQGVFLSRLQAFVKFGVKLYEVREVIHLNGRTEDCSFQNISLEPDYGDRQKQSLKPEEIAYNRGYRVTKDGVVVNVDGKVIRASLSSTGYLIFGTGSKRYHDNPFYNIRVHRLQAFIKFGRKMFDYKVVRHKDGDKLNNSFDNILVGSYVDNYHDIPKKDRENIIKKMAITKANLTEEEIKEIFILRQKGLYYYQIAEHFNISKGWVWQIINGPTIYTNSLTFNSQPKQ